jgi:hypothetical protein
MSDFETLVDEYIASWNERDPQRRRAAIEKIWTADCCYVDPLGAAVGIEAVDTMIAGVQERFGDFTFRLAGSVDAHHDVARFRWELGPVGAEDMIIGFDVAAVDDDGRLRAVYGFLDKVPAS